MSAWKLIESILSEGKMYRGETSVRIKDLRSLFDHLTKEEASKDPMLARGPNPQGGVISCNYAANARVWNRWHPNIDFAKILAGTDARDTQHRGAPQGGTVMKRTYGGRVVYEPGPTSREHERMGSAMDRYDVLMVADIQDTEAIDSTKPINWPDTDAGKPQVIVRRIAWSPSIGTAEERQARLQGLLSGQQVAPLSRRPQGEVPDMTKAEREKAAQLPNAKAAPRFGHDSDTNRPSRGHGQGSGKNSDGMNFKDMLKQHDSEYTASAAKKQLNAPDEDDPDRLFSPRQLPRSKM